MPAPREAYTYEGRLLSFESAVPTAKRGPGTAKARKPVSWPHETPTPNQLARAGFYFRPTPTYLDNVACFLCNKSLECWNADDDPIAEHLQHSKGCGFAMIAAIESRGDHGDFSRMNPLCEELMSARKLTFQDDWPHEHKKGWQPKVDKMVAAGWHYAPTQASDDYVTCAYCGLALDGWEPEDDPLEEHQRRAVECSFFTLIQSHGGFEKPQNRKGRASKASRLSTQSTSSNWMVLAPDSSMVEPESFMSTTSTTSVSRKMPKGRKGKAPKPKTARGRAVSKQSEIDVMEPEDSDFNVKVTDMAPPPVPPKKGRKRKSDEMDIDTAGDDEELAPRAQKAARTRGNSVTEASRSKATTETDHEDAPPKKKSSRKAPSKAKGSRASASKKRVASTASIASVASLRMASPDEDELERELEKGLNSSAIFYDAEGVDGDLSPTRNTRQRAASTKASMAPSRILHHNSDLMSDDLPHQESSVLKKTKAKGKASKANSKASKKNYDLHEDAPASPALRAATEMLTRASPIATLLPAKGRPTRAAAARQVSQELDALKSRSPAQIPDSSIISSLNQDDLGNDSDVSRASQSTIKGAAKKRKQTTKATKKSKTTKTVPKEPIDQSIVDLVTDHDSMVLDPPYQKVSKPKAKAAKNGGDKARSETLRDADHVPKTKKAAAKETRHLATPSPSPQSSDAENQPPSSRPSALTSKTPNVMSPSKRAVIDGAALKSNQQWTALDLDTVFLKSPEGKENEGGLTAALKTAQILTSPEKKMTVTEWLMYHAKTREESLRLECERIVGVWESHGNRALRTLEGIEVEP